MKFGKFIAVILSLLIIISAFPVIASSAAKNNQFDTFGRTSSIAIGSRNLSTTEYLNNYSSLVNKFTYGNGVYKNYTYDNLDRVLTESINGNQILSYLYDKRGNLVRVNDLQANVVTDFVFDLIGRPQGIKMSDGQRLHISYDNLNRVSLSKWSLNGISQLTEYIYGSNTVSGQKNGLIYGVKNNGNQVISYNYDELCRLASRTLNTTTPYITEYGYLEGSAPNTTTALVKTLKNGNNTYEYSYDDVGNITEVKLNGVTIESYTYDSLGQLTSATYNGDTYTYLYDNGGNITEVKKNGTVIKAYTYGNSEWKDLLTEFNGDLITYDTIGNPLSYRDGYSFTWANGRQLVNIEKDNNALATYTYNADGLRTSKTVNGVTTNYYWINGILQGQKTGDEYIIFLYDENGTAYGMLIKNSTTESTYYYVRNLQGDIIGILDSSGTQVVSYTYGAWGDILSVGGSLATTIGQQNPLRYRGYYYDSETGFYYLQSRYYDTVTQRFLNADGFVSTGQGILGNNMFTYCGNNPVNRVDPNGEGFLDIAKVFLLHFLFGKGKDVTADNSSNLASSLKLSKIMNKKVDEELTEYKNGDNNLSGTVHFNNIEPDLWLAIRRANYKMEVIETSLTFSEPKFSSYKSHKIDVYVIKIKVWDKYDFNKGNEKGDGIGSILNNIGYWLQKNNIGKAYDWSVDYFVVRPR